jgi:uncharacterized protein (TIGR00730 family)
MIRDPFNPFPSSAEDAQRAAERPAESPQTSAAAYRLAYMDEDFLLRPELRSVRLQLELLKPELLQQEAGIRGTVVIFGSARLPETSPHYREARRLAEMITRQCQQNGCCDLTVVTGGGPGIMEAANRGAHDAGGKSIGLNIVLPFEQGPNPYVTPDLSFQFHYFAIRKMHFLIRARAMVAFAGGFGTLDELFETLTLVQTRKIDPLPIVLVGRSFWERVVSFPALVEEGVISPADLDLFHLVDTADEAWTILGPALGLRQGGF